MVRQYSEMEFLRGVHSVLLHRNVSSYSDDRRRKIIFKLANCDRPSERQCSRLIKGVNA